MNNLTYLSICDTDIDSGLEYLPKNCETFDCGYEYEGLDIEERKVKKIRDQ
jgi:hypothetical protein